MIKFLRNFQAMIEHKIEVIFLHIMGSLITYLIVDKLLILQGISVLVIAAILFVGLYMIMKELVHKLTENTYHRFMLTNLSLINAGVITKVTLRLITMESLAIIVYVFLFMILRIILSHIVVYSFELKEKYKENNENYENKLVQPRVIRVLNK